MKSPYRTNAAPEEKEPDYMPKWKYVLMSAGWGAVGIVFSALAIIIAWAGPPSCESPCQDTLIEVSSAFNSKTTQQCPVGTVYRGVLFSGEKAVHFCQCRENAAVVIDASTVTP